MRIQLAVIAVMGLFSTGAHGQECPASVDDSNSRRLLAGLDIIEGKIHADERGEAILRPEAASDDEHVWKFRGPIGSKELWMRCFYRDTHVRVTQRMGAHAIECRVMKSHSTTPGEIALVHASCGAHADTAMTLDVDQVVHLAASLEGQQVAVTG